MNKREKNILMFVVCILCALSFFGGFAINEAWGQEAPAQEEEPKLHKGQKVIGKAYIKKGTAFGGILFLGEGLFIPTSFVAFEDTEVYLFRKDPPAPGVHDGGYIADGENFPHDCPQHGREPTGPSIFGIPIGMVKDGTVKVELFGE